ncbi:MULTISPECIES: hypothetical protein [Bacillus cereus group]|nr:MULTISPECIES: hypothetical protein [Bacillus cereus group]EKS7870530.1 hypothetical protein [Bacillus cereus]MCC2507689.1 hypothetical protein [Bacillus cereus]MCU4978447.1 hypothetical protein [Bacillus cereus]MCU5667717.1 hypothetical protein [Bacillus cereus]MDA2208657.1 hypothetical protein [Bacillus cereus]
MNEQVKRDLQQTVMVKQEETHGCGVQFVMKNIPLLNPPLAYFVSINL